MLNKSDKIIQARLYSPHKCEYICEREDGTHYVFRRLGDVEYYNLIENPTGETLERINETADKIGMYTWGFNSMLLTATNYVQLPKILGSSRRADKAMINEIRQDLVGGDFTKTLAKTKFVTRSD